MIDRVDRLLGLVGTVTVHEFRAQDSTYDRDSKAGRELLFLIANDEWIRGTTEIVTADRADAVETTVQVDVDLDRVRHEAFRDVNRFTIPLLILAPPRPSDLHGQAAGARRDRDWFKLIRRPTAPRLSGVADPLVALTVTDASGALVPTIPTSEVHHRIAAALAEIFINMAVARWSGSGQRPEDSRDQRLLLSAAIFRLLRRPTLVTSLGAGTDVVTRAAQSERPVATASSPASSAESAQGRIAAARDQLNRVLGSYRESYEKQHAPAVRTAGGDALALLTERAVHVLDAFAGAVLVAVAMPRARSPAIFRVYVPARRLVQPRARLLRRPRARLEVDLLVPSSDATRQVQVVLPRGLTTEVSKGTVSAWTRIRVGSLRPFDHLAELMGQLVRESNAPEVRSCVADLALTKIDAGVEALRHYELDTKQTPDVEERLRKLRRLILRAMRKDSQSLDLCAQLREQWGDGSWVPQQLWRRTTVDALSPTAVTARADAIEDPLQRACPQKARVRLDITVMDASLFDIARYAGLMSIVLMLAVIGFLLWSSSSFNVEVLAGALTIFSVIQASRVQHPDRSTLPGLLGSSGYWVILASVLPTLLLAVALAFVTEPDQRGLALALAVCALGLQLVLQVMMIRGRLSDTGAPTGSPGLVLETDSIPDYARVEVLRSTWWRSTTAEALLLGREAHGYVVRQQGEGRSLTKLLEKLDWRDPKTELKPPSDRRPAQSVLALMRTGTWQQSLTFLVFREKPVPEWDRSFQPVQVQLDPDRLAPLETPAEIVDILLGMPKDITTTVANHPLGIVLQRSWEHRLMLLDVQLPVPAPRATRAGLRWMRARLGVRDGDIGAVAPLLEALRQDAQGNPTARDVEIRVRLVPEFHAKSLYDPWPQHQTRTHRRPVAASELDVVTLGGNDKQPKDWRVLALCLHRRTGVEADVVKRLAAHAPTLKLAGLTIAGMHGTSVLFMLGHQPGGQSDQTDLEEMRREFAPDHLNVAVDAWLSNQELVGARDTRPLAMLRVRIRSGDRPGMLNKAVDSLQQTLRGLARQAGEEAEPAFDAWYAVLQVTGGQSARTTMTIRVPTPQGPPHRWNGAMCRDAERELRRALAPQTRLPEARGGPILDVQPVVSIAPVRTSEYA